MLKTLKNSEILDLVEGIAVIHKGNIESTKKFSYAIIMNDVKHRPTAEAILAISAPSESYAEYEGKRDILIGEYSVKDDDDRPVMTDNKWVTIDADRKSEFGDKLKSLNDEYEDILETRNKDIADFNAILDTEVEVKVITVSLDDVPEEVGKSIQLMKRLMPMID